MNWKRVSKAIVHQPAAQFYDRFVESIRKRIRTAQNQSRTRYFPFLHGHIADQMRIMSAYRRIDFDG